MQKRSKFQIRSDAAKQRWVRDERKEAFWRKHIAAWKKSGQSKRAYCIEHNLSQSSFNAWNREIAMRDREKVTSENAAILLAEPTEPLRNPFVPLRLLPDEKADREPEQLLIEKSPSKPQTAQLDAARPMIEIVVPGGAVIRVDENSSAAFVAELFSSLKGLL